MKFVYEYRTSDNAKRIGVVSAATRDAAFTLLRAQGVRPSRLTEAPGFLNKLFGKGKRWLAIAGLVVACLMLGIIAHHYYSQDRILKTDVAKIDDTMRRQIIGDAAIIEFGLRNGWANVFESEGDRFLASFAVPGIPAGLRNTTEKEVLAALDHRIEVEDGDGIEARQIKAMVEGMKKELREFLADGGTVVEYGQALVDRQEQELRYYNMARREVENAAKSRWKKMDVVALWQRKNSELRRMGIRLIPLPE